MIGCYPQLMFEDFPKGGTFELFAFFGIDTPQFFTLGVCDVLTVSSFGTSRL